VAEEMFLGDISTGAQNDIEHATNLIRKMVCRFGMSDRLGPLSYGTDQNHIFLGHELGRMREYSEETGHEIDQEVRLIAAECYKSAKDLVTAHRDDVKRIADELLRREVLSAEDVDKLIGKKQQKGDSGGAGQPREGGGGDAAATPEPPGDGTPGAAGAGSREAQP
jgi:cell division protease FtsH